MRNRVVALLASAVALATFQGSDLAFAGGVDPFEIGLQAGATAADEEVDSDDLTDALTPTFGLRAAWNFNERLGWFVDAGKSSFDIESSFDDLDELALRTGLEWDFETNTSDLGWFVNGGVGRSSFELDSGGPDDDRNFGSLGIGVKQLFDSGNTLRLEGRWDQTFGSDQDDPLGPDDFGMLRFLLGYSWGIGGKPVDTDGDGVFDRKDKCPDTPMGATVDERGCPMDSDGDGVMDGLDKCPDTPKGWAVDANGCPLDADGDGVPDGKDKCPNTPKGCKVDDNGCPLDSDGDGVCDGIDQCPGTPKGTPVDEKGCPKDSDGDGVTDDKDKCPNTPRGMKVNAEGCPADSDGDGVTDDKDNCPGTPAGIKVGADGCPEVAPLFTPGKSVFILEGVNFDTDKADIRPDAREILDRAVASLKAYPDVNVQIQGHTDSQASDAYNDKLSDRRANSVMQYFINAGIAASRMTAKGFGERNPIADNKTKEGRAKNRRVELHRAN
jgi:outer membrane protein OmpA-like peptidoglycan-associated protein